MLLNTTYFLVSDDKETLQKLKSQSNNWRKIQEMNDFILRLSLSNADCSCFMWCPPVCLLATEASEHCRSQLLTLASPHWVHQCWDVVRQISGHDTILPSVDPASAERCSSHWTQDTSHKILSLRRGSHERIWCSAMQIMSLHHHCLLQRTQRITYSVLRRRSFKTLKEERKASKIVVTLWYAEKTHLGAGGSTVSGSSEQIWHTQTVFTCNTENQIICQNV